MIRIIRIVLFIIIIRLAWNSEQAAMGNSTLPTVCDKLNIMASMHNRKLIAALVRELNEKDSIIEKFEGRMVSLEDRLNQLSLEIKGIGADERQLRVLQHNG